MLRVICTALLLTGLVLTLPCAAQEEVAGADRYKLREASTGYYEQYEVLPSRGSPFVQWNAPAETVTTGGRAPAATYQADAHALVQNYRHQRCESCHKVEAYNNRHATRKTSLAANVMDWNRLPESTITSHLSTLYAGMPQSVPNAIRERAVHSPCM